MIRVLGIDPGLAPAADAKHPTGGTGWCILDVFPAGKSLWVDGGRVDTLTLKELTAIVQDNKVEHVAVETPVPAAQGALRNLVETALIAGELLGWSQFMAPVSRYTASEWRRALTGAPGPKDSVVKYHLEDMLDLPKKSNRHARDAAGLAWHAGRVVLGNRVAA